jgi:hypothetical protein
MGVVSVAGTFLSDSWMSDANEVLQSQDRTDGPDGLVVRFVIDDERTYAGEQLLRQTKSVVEGLAQRRGSVTLLFNDGRLQLAADAQLPDVEITLSSGAIADVLLSSSPVAPSEVYARGMMIAVGDMERLALLVAPIAEGMNRSCREQIRGSTTDLSTIPISPSESEMRTKKLRVSARSS